MNVLKYRVSLDMFDTHSQTTIKAKKSDSACQIHITLSEKGKIYNIGEGCSATFNARKSDGNFIYDNCTIENNTIVYDFTSSVDENGVCQVSACEGIVDCEVTLYNADGKQLTSPRFTLFIDGTVYNGEEIASTPQSDFFKEIVAEAVRNKQDKFADISVDNEGYVTLTPSKSIRIAATDDNGQVALVGRYASLFADYVNLHGSVSILGDLDFGYGNGKITNLATPDGTDPTQAANVEYVANSRKMRLIQKKTVGSGEKSHFIYNIDDEANPLNLDEIYMFVSIPTGTSPCKLAVYINGVLDAAHTLLYQSYSSGTVSFWVHAERIANGRWKTIRTTPHATAANRQLYSSYDLELIDFINEVRVNNVVEGVTFEIFGRQSI